jgi:hypothetical protein
MIEYEAYRHIIKVVSNISLTNYPYSLNLLILLMYLFFLSKCFS